MNYLGIPVFPLVADLGESVRRTLNYEPEVTDIGFGAQPSMPVQASTQERLQIVTVAPDTDVPRCGGGVLCGPQRTLQGFLAGERR